ncbi:MAG TPA: hypothetical protein VMU34_16130 [Mycobacterium sp.]|nr:hypothetical protein [Mycobacterium sp.]
MVTWFHVDRTIEVSAPKDAAALKAIVDESAASTNLMAAIRVTGESDGGHPGHRRVQ